MKRHVIVILIVIGMICSIGCVMADNQASGNPGDIQSISKDGITIRFPSDWGISKASSNYSIIAISDLSSVDSNGVAEVNINIERDKFEGSFETFVNDTYAKMKKIGDYNLTSSGQVAVGDMEGLEYTYTSDINGTQREHKAIWLEHGDEAYVIMYSAPIDQFDSNLKIFDYVIHNIQIN
ncbi:MAG: hypothetical protein Q4P18_01025 [Methanobrevibacter sp.]|uniref:hypothetical protein n=1 Tax=Methanobrevibacter sp. TaxID=66852 RepID=UPI0026DFE110|nr:hypothetical protein [Methanobrevibacter sp.]MDO5848096.1 hypothetical protein [Methanobrevibacter sp.]